MPKQLLGHFGILKLDQIIYFPFDFSSPANGSVIDVPLSVIGIAAKLRESPRQGNIYSFIYKWSFFVLLIST